MTTTSPEIVYKGPGRLVRIRKVMNRIVMNRTVFFILLLAVSISAHGAGGYWVVGDLSDREAAIKEGERLSSATGVEVLLQPIDESGDTSYRLLVRLFTDEYDQVRLKSQLRFAGVNDVVRIELNGSESELQSLFAVIDYSGEVVGSSSNTLPPAEPEIIQMPAGNPESSVISGPAVALTTESPETSNYMVVGSFRQEEEADKFRKKLEASFGDAFIKKNANSEDALHRVVIGPIDVAEEEEYIRRAVLSGIEGAWILRGARSAREPLVAENLVVADLDSDSEQPEKERVSETKPGLSPESDPPQMAEQVDVVPEDDGYNAAKLNTSSGGFFLNQKQ
jgi:hypothetical protein